MDTYVKHYCSECKKHYYVCLGDLQDPTGVDVEGGICPYCETKDLFYESEDLFYEFYPNYVRGAKQLL